MAVDLEFPTHLKDVPDKEVVSMAEEMESYVREIEGDSSSKLEQQEKIPPQEILWK